MKLTTKRLKKLIREELKKLNESDEGIYDVLGNRIDTPDRIAAINQMRREKEAETAKQCKLYYRMIEMRLMDALQLGEGTYYRERNLPHPDKKKINNIVRENMEEAFQIHKDHPECKFTQNKRIKFLFTSVIELVEGKFRPSYFDIWYGKNVNPFDPSSYMNDIKALKASI